jgi:hypothetical protein
MNPKEMLEASQRPLFLYDDDADGVCSFLLLYRFIKRGHGIIVKSSPEVKSEFFLGKVKQYDPDLVVILDKPLVERSFLEEIKVPILWIDHHEPVNPDLPHVCYVNPGQSKHPTTAECWEIVKNDSPEDIWIAVTGCVGDWHFPKELLKEFDSKYPNLIDLSIKTAPELLFTTKIGTLVRVIYFNLKGPTEDVKSNLKVLTRINGPKEILSQTTPAGKYLYQKYSKMRQYYERMKKTAINSANDSPFIISIFTRTRHSFSSELSNELLYLFPKKVIVLGRNSSGYYKCSVRTTFNLDLPKIISKCLEGLEGHGGGHKQACGVGVKEDHWELFLDRFKEEIKKKLD